MTEATQPDTAPRPLPARLRAARLAYQVAATTFLVGVVVQVLFAGLGTLVTFGDFDAHRTFGETLVWVIPVMFAAGLAGRVPRRTSALTALLFGLYALQWILLYAPLALGAPGLRALHAVNALAIFWLGLHLARPTWRGPECRAR